MDLSTAEEAKFPAGIPTLIAGNRITPDRGLPGPIIREKTTCKCTGGTEDGTIFLSEAVNRLYVSGMNNDS